MVGSIDSISRARVFDTLRCIYLIHPILMELLPFGRDPINMGLLRVCLSEAIYRRLLITFWG